MKNRSANYTGFFLALACFASSQKLEAVLPPPDGGYPGNNTAEGQSALFSLTTGTFNTAVGSLALRSNIIGNGNTSVGAGTLLANTADQNTATGVAALLSNTTGAKNTANGALALLSNIDGFLNSACGAFALFSNSSGADNTADGAFALFANVLGSSNTAIGMSALHSNSSGSQNTAVGVGALENNTGDNNVAIGNESLSTNSAGHDNTACGRFALAINNTGNSNTADGSFALSRNTSGSNNTAVGYNAGSNVSTANNVICVGIAGQNVSDSFYVGNVFQTDIDADNLPVRIDVTGRLGTQSSSRRFKEDIQPMDRASDAILKLKPVTFHYKNDARHNPQFGLIAEQVAEIDPTLVAFDQERKPYTVRYDQVNAMLLNEFLKEHHKVQELEKGMAALTVQLKEQSVQIQKISAHVTIHGSTTKTEIVAGVADPARSGTEEKE
jgi:hypothetical protein